MSAAAGKSREPERAPDRDGGAEGGFFKSTGFALAVLVAVVLIATPFGAWRSLRGAVRDVERQFYTGVAPYGAVADYLADSENAALGLITLGAKYDALSAQTQALRESRETFMTVLGDKSSSISDIEAANGLLRESFDGLRDALTTAVPLSEQEGEDLDYYSRQFDSSQGAVARSGYNEAVEKFNEGVYSRFPAKVIASVFGVDPPEGFRTGA